MFELITAPQNLPFSVALALMFGIALLEGITALFGAAISGMLDSLIPDLEVDADLSDVELQSPHALSRLLSWLRVGKVPVLILLVIFLTGFGLIGLALQSLMNNALGFMFPALIASIPAALLALPIVRVMGGFIGKILPKDETEAVSQDSFIGRIAIITLGVAKAGSPAEAKIKDQFGTTHYIMVEPEQATDELDATIPLLIVKKAGHLFKVIRNENINLIDK
ncbi:MAG: YqiJ family protein [Gammaproteobacteria bacterium]|nr:YqiJ family protein [Gammaproteobacteria bacterium]